MNNAVGQYKDSNRVITSFTDYNATKLNEDAEVPFEIDETILDALVDIVGSEEYVEECAKEAFEDLEKAFERDEIEIKEGDTAERLIMSALVVKLVEKGKLGPQEADSFIEKRL